MSETSERQPESEEPSSDRKRSTKPRRARKRVRLSFSSDEDESSDDKLKIDDPGPYKRRNTAHLEDAKELIDSGMDEALKEMASKKKLSTTNIKNILWHVVTNENVLSMVRNTMMADTGAKPEELEEAPFQPRITRSKARLMEEAARRNGTLPPPWPISPIKQPEPNKKSLLDLEFSESDDEEFDPVDAEEKSDEEEEESFAETPSSPPRCSAPPSELEMSKEEDKIALRTRSKLPLQDTPLETLEAQLVASDLEFHTLQPELDCRGEDDEPWKAFLFDFQKPLFPPSSPPDEDNDPDFKFQEEEDIPDFWELRSDKCVNISKRELKQLWRESLDLQGDPPLNEEEEDEEEEEEPRELLFPNPVVQQLSAETPSSEMEPRSSEPELRLSDSEASPPYSQEEGELITLERRLLIEEQMRMYVQILTQTILLAHNPDYIHIANSCYFYLQELGKAADMSPLKDNSTFNAFNLRPALHLIEVECHDTAPLLKTCRKYRIPQKIQDVLAHSPVFIYPQLLPTCNYTAKHKPSSKPKFISPEDHLLVLGLEEFSTSPSRNLVPALTLVRDWLMPVKTVTQLKTRIRTVRFTQKSAYLDNPIHHFFKTRKAPTYQHHLIPFDPSNVVAPAKQPLSALPSWMADYVTYLRGDAASHSDTPSYRKILPHPLKTASSPMKTVSPILKKYRMLSTRPKVHIPKFELPSAGEEEVSSTGTLDQLQLAMVQADISPGPQCLPDSTSEEPLPAAITAPAADSQEDTCEEEQDLAALMQASTTIQRQRRRKAKSERDLQSLLALLDPSILNNDPKKKDKKEYYAKNYLMRVKEALADQPDQLEAFVRALVQFFNRGTKSIKQLYEECMAILKDHPALVRDFTPFLTQEDAQACGLYREHLTFGKMKLFIRKLEVYTKNQPQQMQKMLRALRQCKEQMDSGGDLEIPLVLRNNPLILEDFIQLLPHERPPDSLMTDFEEFTLPDSGDEGSRDSVESFQPPKKAPEQYGTRQCPCQCHATSRDHCEQCGTRFLGGRVYRRCGSLLRPAQVVVLNSPSPDIPASSECEDVLDFDTSLKQDSVMPQSPTEPAPSDAHHWTREDDGLLLKTFKIHGVKEKVYRMVASQLGISDVQQVKVRFYTLMKLFESHSKKQVR